MSSDGIGSTGPDGMPIEVRLREIEERMEPAASAVLGADERLRAAVDERVAVQRTDEARRRMRILNMFGAACQQCQAALDDVARIISQRALSAEECASLPIWRACAACPDAERELVDIRRRCQEQQQPVPRPAAAPGPEMPEVSEAAAPAPDTSSPIATVAGVPTAQLAAAQAPTHPACARLGSPAPGERGRWYSREELRAAGYWVDDQVQHAYVLHDTCDESGCVDALLQTYDPVAGGWSRICPLPPPVPQPPPPGPPPAGPACIPLCQPQCPPEREWVLWRSADGECYLARSDAPPRDPSDEQLARSVDAAALAARLAQCAPPDTSAARSRVPRVPRPEMRVETEVQCPPDGWTREIAEQIAVAMPGIDELLSAIAGTQVSEDTIWDVLWNAITHKNALVQLAGMVAAPIVGGITGLWQVFRLLVQPLGCDSKRYAELMVPRILLSFLRHWFIPDLDGALLPWRYLTQSLCPTCMPDVQETRTAYLRGVISHDRYVNWQRQNNRCIEQELQVLDALQASLTPAQAVQALWRGILSPEEYREQIRRNQWLRPDAAEMWLRLAEPIPPVQDIIRMMIRDVADPAVVARFRLDDLFADKYQGPLRQWGEMQGISEEVARAYWRAHWTIPSPTQLFEMWHRSRALPDGHPAKITFEDIRQALIQQDILPFWIEPLLQTSFSVLRLVDIRRALEIGAIDRDEVRRQLVKRGYDDRDADIITEFYVRQQQRGFRRHQAVQEWHQGRMDWADVAARLRADGATEATIEEIRRRGQRYLLQVREVREYAQGIWTWPEVQDRLVRLGADPDTIERAHDWGLRRRLAAHRRRCIAAVADRVRMGELDRLAAQQLLVDLMRDPAEAQMLVDAWLCERSMRSRQVTASQMCGWLERGLITPDEMLARLIRLGYTDGDALRVLAACGIDIAERTRRRLEQERRKREAAQRRAEQELARQRREEERRTREREMRLAQLRRARERRERRMADLASRLAERVGQPVDAVAALMRASIRRLTETTPLDADERLQVIEDVVMRRRPATLEEYDRLVDETAVAHLEAEHADLGPTNGDTGDGEASGPGSGSPSQ